MRGAKGFGGLNFSHGEDRNAAISAFLRSARLRKRALFMVGLAATLGFLARLSSVNGLALFIVLVVGILFFAGLVWVGFGLFRKVSPAPEGKKPTPRFVRVAAGLVILAVSLPIALVSGHALALAVAPYSELELQAQAERAERIVAEAEARRQLQEEEEAAEAAAFLAEEQAAREAEEAVRAKAEAEEKALREAQEKINLVIAGLTGLSADEAKSTLQRERIRFVERIVCSSEPGGTVVQALAQSDLRVLLSVAKNATTVPDVIGKAQGQAFTTLKSGCYNVEVSSFYATTNEGQVFAVSPAAGTALAANETVRIFVSKPQDGVRYTANSLMSLGSSSSNLTGADFGFSTPFEDKGKLYIPIRATFGSDFDWRDTHDMGTGFGTAVITDQFDKEVPVIVYYTSRRAPAGEEQYFTVEVPLTDLQIQRPTSISLFLYITHSGRSESIRPKVTLTW